MFTVATSKSLDVAVNRPAKRNGARFALRLGDASLAPPFSLANRVEAASLDANSCSPIKGLCCARTYVTGPSHDSCKPRMRVFGCRLLRAPQAPPRSAGSYRRALLQLTSRVLLACWQHAHRMLEPCWQHLRPCSCSPRIGTLAGDSAAARGCPAPCRTACCEGSRFAWKKARRPSAFSFHMGGMMWTMAASARSLSGSGRRLARTIDARCTC